jgi:hypothetical protein
MHGVKATVIASAVIPGCPSGLDSVTMALSVAMLAGEPRHRGWDHKPEALRTMTLCLTHPHRGCC